MKSLASLRTRISTPFAALTKAPRSDPTPTAAARRKNCAPTNAFVIRRKERPTTGRDLRGKKKKADEADAKALEKLRTTIIGVVSFLSEKPAKSGGALSEPAQFAMLADGSFLDTLAWQFRKWMADARESKRKLECEAAKYRLLKEMVEPVAGKPNRLHPLLQSAEEDFGTRGTTVAEVIAVYERALEILHDHQFKVPQALKSEPASEADEWEGFEPDVPNEGRIGQR
jgi:hypothetical protein